MVKWLFLDRIWGLGDGGGEECLFWEGRGCKKKQEIKDTKYGRRKKTEKKEKKQLVVVAKIY